VPAGPAQTQTSCYRHPDRPAPISCTRCGRPICVDDAVDAPVGYLCPECAQQPAHVQRAQRRVAGAQSARATMGLLGVIVVVYVAQLGTQLPNGWSELVIRGGLFGPAIAEGEWWRVLTSGFLHSDGLILHVLFNGYLLYQLGRMLEPGVGSSRFLALFLAGLFGGSAGALLLDWQAITIGASGAVFGLMGAAMVLLRRRGINPWRTSIGTLVIINLVFTFMAPGVSMGGHVGGLVAGALAALPLFRSRDRGSEGPAVWGIALAFGALALYAGVAGPVL
jgi:membrane associated rhomboid family serine protease